MIIDFSKILLKKIFWGKNKQHLLIIAICGLFLSSFSLIVLQATMGGLQNGLIERSKKIEGHGVFEIENGSLDMTQELLGDLKKSQLLAFAEIQLELLLKNGRSTSPAIIHGVDQFGQNPASFLQSTHRDGLILGHELARKLDAQLGSVIEIISPMVSSSLIGELPRSVSVEVSDFISLELPEHDGHHAWVRATLLQNLIRKRQFNKIRIYSKIKDSSLISSVLAKYQGQVSYTPWEKDHFTLLWAFKLESSVMIFLFIAMSFLVAVAITSGFLIFFGKIRSDLLSLWILGASEKTLMRSNRIFLIILSAVSSLGGILVGLVLLLLLDQSNLMIMPEIFVERKIPVNVTLSSICLSFFIPFFISLIFGLYTLEIFFKDEHGHAQLLRSKNI